MSYGGVMDISQFTRHSETEWLIEASGRMRVPAVIFATEELVRDMDQKVFEQTTNVAMLPGIVKASFAMPDAHWGYGFPIGGVAAFARDGGGVVSAGGVGFDVSCGVRTMTTGLTSEEVEPVKSHLADALFRHVPAGVGSRGKIKFNDAEMDEMLAGGASWARGRGYGTPPGLWRIEGRGGMRGVRPEAVSARARNRQREEMGTLGSGNHYCEVQRVADVYDAETASTFGLRLNEVVISVHCGSRGLGHQIGTEFLKKRTMSAPCYGTALPDRDLACAPINSSVGEEYLGPMRA